MIALIDLDSILYGSVYKCISINQIRELLQQGTKQEVRNAYKQMILDESINRTENKILNILQYLNDVHFEVIDESELYITTCSKNFRNEIQTTYKGNRKKNNYVWMVREYYRNNDAICSETLEADDLIADRCKELNHNDYVVVSIDKDLKTIGGYYWSYYMQKSKDIDGNFIKDEYGNYEKEYKQKNIEYISKEKASFLFWQQMLTGDVSDNIKGVRMLSAKERNEIDKYYNLKTKTMCGLGDKNAKKLLDQGKNKFITVAREYIKRGQKQDFKINHRLLKLGQ